MITMPSFYDQSRCGKLVKPECEIAARAGSDFAKKNSIPPSLKGGTAPNIILVAIDMQIDFVSSDVGNLYVPGAEQDVHRLNQFIATNVASISEIVASLDTHYLFQPFHPFNWVAGKSPARRHDGTPYLEGDHPDPFTLITKEDLGNDIWQPSRHISLMREYVDRLETDRKKTLCIWPLHCEEGTPGRALDPTFMEMIHWHAAARKRQYNLTIKGMSQLSEHYGILKAEVRFDQDPNTQLNVGMIDKWSRADRIYFCGQAKTHCVLETLRQTVDIFKQRSPEILEKLFVLQDVMSPVPDIKDSSGNVLVPFNEIANDAFADMAKDGVKFIDSTDPIDLVTTI